jgi:hypothetical protein
VTPAGARGLLAGVCSQERTRQTTSVETCSLSDCAERAPAPFDLGEDLRLQDGFSVRVDDGSPGTYVDLEVAYE